MMGKNYLTHIVFICSILLYNCEGSSEDDSSSPTGPGGSESDEPILALEHQEGLKFKLKTYNFPEVKFIQIFLEYNTDQLTFSNSTTGAIGNPSFVISDSSGVYFIFSLSAPISGNVEIVGLSFSGGSYNNTKIIVKDLYVLDNNDNPVTGIQFGGLCYLDNGIIDQAINNTSEPLENWAPTGNYVWDYIFCGYIE